MESGLQINTGQSREHHQMRKSNNAFAGLGDVLGAGFGDLMAEGDQFAEVDLNDISVKPQVRETFEDDENTLADLEASIRRHKVFQPILIRPVDGGPRPYELVAGERRYIASERAGKTNIPALIRVLTDEEARDMQLAENIQRKNLTQIEEAKRIQEDLDRLGSVDAVLEKHSKSRAWLSKILSLLTLPEQAKRLVTEQVSADIEVINKVKTIEKIDPQAAKQLVDDLKATRGKADARKKADAVKETVKPSNKPAKGITATPKDLSHQESGTPVVQNFADAKTGSAKRPPPALIPAEPLSRAYGLIFENGSSPKMVLELMEPEDRANVEAWLESFYDAGMNAKNVSLAVIQGFRKGTFAADGAGAFALLAFLQGADEEVHRFNVLNVLGLAKA
jgi:ParB family transcriptional regulator, chromosome partitioning protein